MSFSNINISERRLSVNGRNAYLTVSVEESEPKNKKVDDSAYLTAKPLNRASSCSPTLLTRGDNITKENKLTNNTNNTVNNSSPISLAPESMPNISPQFQKTAAVSTNLINPKTGAIPKIVPPFSYQTKPQIQVGIDRYITVLKRGRSPKSSKVASAPKLIKEYPSNGMNSQNRFSILQDNSEEPIQVVKPSKPPPIYLREQNSNDLIKRLVSLVGEKAFYVVPFKRGNICETKIQVNQENDYRKIVNDFELQKKSFYTYQLKSSKGLQVVLKGIDSCVGVDEIKESLHKNGYKVKHVINIRNKENIPQPMFRVELEPGDIKLKKNESHPIYNLKYLLHRKIIVEEPYKRKGPIQCANCQEFGHTRTYCKLPPVCVICGELHGSAQCNKPKNDLSVKKCSNCGGNHTANYRGCPVYSFFRKSSVRKQNVITTQSVDNTQYPQITQINVNKNSYASVLKANSNNTPFENPAPKTKNNKSPRT